MRSFVRAEKAGFAPTVLGRFQMGEGRELAKIELDLGGWIEGEIRTPALVQAPRIAELCRIDPFHRSSTRFSNGDADELDVYAASVDEHGRYRFEHVAPGPWLLRVKPAGEEWGDVWRNRGKSAQLPVTLEVEEGQPCRADIDATKAIATTENRERRTDTKRGALAKDPKTRAAAHAAS